MVDDTICGKKKQMVLCVVKGALGCVCVCVWLCVQRTSGRVIL